MQINKRSWKVDEIQLRLHILPVLGKLYGDKITKQHAIDPLDQHQTGKEFQSSSTNRVLFAALRPDLRQRIEDMARSGLYANSSQISKALK